MSLVSGKCSEKSNWGSEYSPERKISEEAKKVRGESVHGFMSVVFFYMEQDSVDKAGDVSMNILIFQEVNTKNRIYICLLGGLSRKNKKLKQELS